MIEAEDVEATAIVDGSVWWRFGYTFSVIAAEIGTTFSLSISLARSTTRSSHNSATSACHWRSNGSFGP
jgi:hypothetical protein